MLLQRVVFLRCRVGSVCDNHLAVNIFGVCSELPNTISLIFNPRILLLDYLLNYWLLLLNLRFLLFVLHSCSWCLNVLLGAMLAAQVRLFTVAKIAIGRRFNFSGVVGI